MADERDETSAWAELLSEPITSVRDEGWRAIRSVEEFSPRGQQVLAALPPPESFLIVPRPLQPEEDLPLPPSLAEQLSLTWAARRRRRSRGDSPSDEGLAFAEREVATEE